MPPKQMTVNGYALWVENVGMHMLSQRMGGRHVSMAQACKDCHEFWNAMTDDDKQSWKTKAKEYKQSEDFQKKKREYKIKYIRDIAYHDFDEAGDREREIVTGTVNRKPTKKKHDEPNSRMAQVFYSESAQNLLARKRRADVQEILDNLNFTINPRWLFNDRLAESRKRIFKLISFSPYSVIEQAPQSNVAGASTGDEPVPLYPPAEVAVISFSMNEGITHVLHRLIITNEPKLLCDEGVKQRAEDSINPDNGGHGIPIQPTKELQDQFLMNGKYFELLTEIQDRIGEERFVFVLSTEYNQVLGGLQWLCDAAMDDKGRAPKLPDTRRFVCIEDLLTALYKWEPHKPPPQEDMDEKMALLDPRNAYWNAYDENDKTLCHYHCTTWNSNCAEARAKKSVYGFFDALMDEYQFEIDTDHMPNPGSNSLPNMGGFGRPQASSGSDSDAAGSSASIDSSGPVRPSFGAQSSVETGFQSSASSYQPSPPVEYDSAGFAVKKTGFGGQKTGFGPQNSGFVDQKAGFGGQQTGFGAQRTGFGDQQTGFGDQSAGFGDQQTGFGSGSTSRPAVTQPTPTLPSASNDAFIRNEMDIVQNGSPNSPNSLNMTPNSPTSCLSMDNITPIASPGPPDNTLAELDPELETEFGQMAMPPYGQVLNTIDLPAPILQSGAVPARRTLPPAVVQHSVVNVVNNGVHIVPPQEPTDPRALASQTTGLSVRDVRQNRRAAAGAARAGAPVPAVNNSAVTGIIQGIGRARVSSSSAPLAPVGPGGDTGGRISRGMGRGSKFGKKLNQMNLGPGIN